MDSYPYTVNRDDGTVVVNFPDVPIAHSVGKTKAEAIARAIDALETAFIAMMVDREDIPRSSPARGRPTVTLPPMDAAKVGIYRAMRAQNVTKAELARKLDCHPPQVDRLLDLRHASTLAQIEAAAACLGKRLVVDVRDAA